MNELSYIAERHRSLAAAEGVAPDSARFAQWLAAGHLRAGRRGRAIRLYVRHPGAGNLGRAAAAVLGDGAIRAARRLVRGQPDRPLWLDAPT
jgi:hypothetical protein